MDGNIKKLRGVIKEQKTEIRELKAFGKRMLKVVEESNKISKDMSKLVQKTMDRVMGKKIPKVPKTIH